MRILTLRRILLAALASASVTLVVHAAAATAADGDQGPPIGPPIHAVLTSPPIVPPPTHRVHPAKVIVELEIKEVEKEISEGVRYTFWTFGGTVPGSFIRVRQGDTVEFHLKNHPDNKRPHNIDLHGVVGPGSSHWPPPVRLAAPPRAITRKLRAIYPTLGVRRDDYDTRFVALAHCASERRL